MFSLALFDGYAHYPSNHFTYVHFHVVVNENTQTNVIHQNQAYAEHTPVCDSQSDTIFSTQQHKKSRSTA